MKAYLERQKRAIECRLANEDMSSHDLEYARGFHAAISVCLLTLKEEEPKDANIHIN